MISVIVCTRNREDLIDDCVQSLINQKTNYEYEIIVVNNDSDDRTEEKLKRYDQEYANFRFINETKLGLSHARNAGFKNAKYDWVANVDDDAKAHDNFVEIACQTLINSDYDCFGGIYNAWFKYGRPKWFPSDYGTNRHRMPEEETILTEKSFSGGVAVYKKELLQNVGWFPEEMGMKGEKIGYGAENYVQDRARELGYTVGFIPALQIDHLVRKDKLRKIWHYRDKFKKGKSRAFLERGKKIKWFFLKNTFKKIVKWPFNILVGNSNFKANRYISYSMGYYLQRILNNTTNNNYQN